MAKIKNPNTKTLPNLSGLISPALDAERYRILPRQTQIKIAKFALPWFNPPCEKKADPVFNMKWWNSTLGECKTWSDERSCAVWVSLFPARTKQGYEYIQETRPVDFYVEVKTPEEAVSWYACLPDHLKRQVDKELAKRPNGTDAKRDSIYEDVFGRWGDRPELPDEPADPIDGISTEDHFRLEVWRQWVHEYDQTQLIYTVIELAKGIQDERKMLSSALGLSVSLASLPNQAVGLDDTQAATVRWLQSSGETPLEFLADTYRDDTAKMGDRIAAARTLMDYVHRKVPVKTEVDTKDITEPKLDREVLKKLSDKDLSLLESLLAKLEK